MNATQHPIRRQVPAPAAQARWLSRSGAATLGLALALGLGLGMHPAPARAQARAQAQPHPPQTPAAALAQPATAASAPRGADGTQVAQAAYKPVQLASWVPVMRTPGRIILQPSGVSFHATLAAVPRVQKSDYLQMALRTMQVSQPPKVGHALLLRYGDGPDQQLVAYVEDAVAARLAAELKPGDRREFFAFHVYNYAKGPALVVTGFGPAR